MAGQRGRDVQIKVGDDFERRRSVCGGIRARRISLSSRPVEATSAQSPQGWRELIAEAGTKTIEVVGRRAFKNALSDEWMRMAFFLGLARRFQLVVADLGKLKGPLAIADLTYSGEHEDEAAFSIRLASAGVIAFEP